MSEKENAKSNTNSNSKKSNKNNTEGEVVDKSPFLSNEERDDVNEK